VALTGLILLGFVIGHLIGNLQVFSGPEKINVYAEFLKNLGGVLWVIRGFLLFCFVLHIVTTIQLVLENRKARPEQYAFKNNVQSKLSTRMMALSGLTILCFVIFHILHYTTHNVNPEFGVWLDAKGRHDVYRMMIVGFGNPLASGFYIVAILLLSMHLSHGVSSVFQTLGLRTQKTAAAINALARTLALVIAIGYISIPVAVMMGLGKNYLQECGASSASCCTKPSASTKEGN